MVNPERIRRLMDRLEEQVRELDRLATKPRSEIEGDRDVASSIRYNFIVAIECSIDLANHVISSERYRSPQDYSDSFKVLQEEGIIDSHLSERMGSAARFRNRLVHVYWDVDDEMVWEYLHNDREVFREISSAVARFLASR